MAMFDVYVEGATDPSPDATRRLAEVMSQRYGLPAADLTTRLAKGRFRVKASVDSTTAQTYVKDLEAIGARVTLIETRPGGASLPPPKRAGNSVPPPIPSSSRSTAPPPLHPVLQSPEQRTHSTSKSPPMRPDHAVERPFGPAAPARPSAPSLPPSNLPQRPAPTPSNPPATALPQRPTPNPGPFPPPNQQYQSGLSAAFHENTPVPELGALDKDAFSVASLDGREEAVDTSPAVGMSASIGPAPAPPPAAAKPAKAD